MFVSYYHRMGWRVIVYDRFGLHWQFIKELLSLPGFDYYPFTGALSLPFLRVAYQTILWRSILLHALVFQLVHPSKYNKAYADQQVRTHLYPAMYA